MDKYLEERQKEKELRRQQNWKKKGLPGKNKFID